MTELSAGRLLDVRLDGSPLLGAVRIPLAELRRRVFELPAPGSVVHVADTSVDALAAVGLLTELGRVAELVPAVEGDDGKRYRLWNPPAWLEEVAPTLPVGRALCLACGTGREAVYRGDGPAITWVAADLRQPELPISEAFDLVTQFLFWSPCTPLQLRAHLAPGGLGLLEAFSDKYREAKGTSQGRLWKAEDWEGWSVEASSGQDGRTERILVRA